MATLFAYIDESGQDTMGGFFVVSIVIAGKNRDVLLRKLLAIEQQSNKHITKWHKAKYQNRIKYIQLLLETSLFYGSIFYSIYSEGKEYLAHTSDATAKALTHKRADKFTIYLDGYKDAELAHFKRHLRPSIKVPTQIRGVRKDENNAFIRLADAMCGLVRDAHEGDVQAKKLVQKLTRKNILEKA